MKKSYHSTVVPTTVANTTRRRSVEVAMVPVGVKPVGVCADMSDSNVVDFVVRQVVETTLAGGSQIIYDFKYNARARELMTTSTDAAAGRSGPLPGRPGKIIAVHLSYASRADQRGRRPADPSYFFKPSSSVAASGGTIARPAGTELLAFEGEIALVIGTTARRVSLADAWQHVGWITAANDFGLYDLRANDKGSNVRSKGGDGFTPIGPTLIDARRVDPASLRLRTWVNG